MTVNVGESSTNVISGTNIGGSTAGFSYSSSNSTIASATSGGPGIVKVTGNSAGTATITVNFYSLSTSFTVTVKSVSYSISVSPSSASLYVGQTKQLSASVSPSGTASWSTSNSSVATVSSSGLVTAKGSGTATITATANGKSASCTVTVSNPTLTLTPTSASIFVGQTQQLTAKPSPSGTVTWTTSSSDVATVSSSGLVTAVAEGTATITASCNGVSKTSEITVIQPTITISPNTTQSIMIGETVQFIATPSPSGTVTWSSSSPDRATITDTGLVTGVGSGPSTIKATCNGVSASCQVWVAVPEITLSQTELTLNVGKTATLVPTAGNVAEGVTLTYNWTSDNIAVATVDADGVVTAVSEGTATIKATSNKGNASCTVIVLGDPTVSVKSSVLTLTFGNTSTPSLIEVTLVNMPEDAHVNWKSSDENVVTVESADAAHASYYGAPSVERTAGALVTPVGPGSATITAEAAGASADIHVSVIDQSDVLDLPTLDDGKMIQVGIGMTADAKNLMNVKWSSSNDDIASVNDNGIIRGESKGDAIITATIGNLSTSFIARVTEDYVVTELKGIEALDGSDLNGGEGEIEFYDLNGFKIDAETAQPGIYIMRRGTSSVKVHLK